MGVIAGALGGLGEGLMAAGKQYGEYAARTSLQEQEAKIQALRDERLAEFTRQRDISSQIFTAGENTKTRDQQAELHRDTEAGLTTRHADTTALGREQLAETKRAHENQSGLDYMRLDISSAQAGEQARHNKATEAIQSTQASEWRNHVTMLPQADGTFMRVTQDGRSLGLAIDPDTKKPVQGTKDVAASTKILMEGNIKQIGALEADYRTAMDATDKQNIRAQIQGLQSANERLSQGLKPEPKEAPPAPGAQKAPDGKWYVPDAKRPGRWQLVETSAAPSGQPAPPPARPPSGVINQRVNEPVTSPLGRAGEALTTGATDVIEATAKAATNATAMRSQNAALRAKVRAGESLTPQERQRAIAIGWLRE